MKSGVLIIGPAEQALIEQALVLARINAVPWERIKALVDRTDATTLLLVDRHEGVDKMRKQYPPQNVILGTYRVAISFEHQPVGLIRHLSVSSAHRGKVPGPQVMEMVAKAFGFTHVPPKRPGRVWMEEFEPGRMAVNVAEVEPKGEDE